MKVVLILRFAILTCIFLGGLLAIIATAGKEWQKIENEKISVRYKITETNTLGLWKYCFTKTLVFHFSQDKQKESTCKSVNDLLDLVKIFGKNTKKLEGKSSFK